MFYAALFVLLLILWPWGLWRDDSPGLSVLWLGVNTALVALVWYQSSSDEMGFFGGLEAVGEKMRVGFVPLSLMVLAVVFPVVIALATLHAVLGIALGRRYAQQRWVGLVTYFENLL